jgi:AcrR family transcriptional regulator
VARTGRRRGRSTTRAAILEAARRRFAEGGYDAASLRLIAADAGVDPAVVVHFFGSKEGLFRSAVGWPFDPERIAAQLASGSPDGLAERVARTFFGIWEDPSARASLLAVLRSAMTHPTWADLMREFTARQLVARVAPLLQGPHTELRINLAAAHLVGVAILRYGIRIEPLASASTEELIARVTPALAVYLR